jgi:hypothetical protein
MSKTKSSALFEPLASALSDGSLLLSQEQLEFQESIRSFVSKEMSADYVRKHFDADIYLHDYELWEQIFSLGLFDYFSSSEQSERGGLRELALVASECGRGLFTCDLPNYLFAGPVMLGRLISSKQMVDAGVSTDSYSSGRKLAIYTPSLRKNDLNQLTVFSANRPVVSGTLRQVPCSKSTSGVFFEAGDDSDLYFVDLEANQGNFEIISSLSLDRTIKRHDLKVDKASCFKVEIDGTIVKSLYRVLLASEISGACQRIVDMTSIFVKERKQFERPIGSFQAVKHKLADMYLKSEAIKALSSFASWAADHSPSQLEFSSTLALSYATSQGPLIAEEAVQLHGGIGFSWEFDLHLFLRRVRMLAGFSPALHEISEDIIDMASYA